MRYLPLAIAFLISLWWHFVVLSFFAIKPISKDYFVRYYPKVTFLGNIISQADSQIKIAGAKTSDDGQENIIEINLPSRARAISTIRMLADKSREIFAKTEAKIELAEEPESTSEKRYDIFDKKAFSRKYLFENREDLHDITDPINTFEIKHHILYPDWARRRGIESELRIYFRVSSDGAVDLVEIDRFSGYPQLDMLGVSEVNKWKFAPLGADDKVPQWGSVIIKYVLD